LSLSEGSNQKLDNIITNNNSNHNGLNIGVKTKHPNIMINPESKAAKFMNK